MKRIGIGIILAGLLAAGFVWALSHKAEKHRTRLRAADHMALLSACRQMVADARARVGEGKLPRSRYDALPSPDRMPMSVLEVNPRYTVIRKDHVMMCFTSLPRVYLLAFAEGAEQGGDEQLLDGLWISSAGPHEYEKANKTPQATSQ